MSDDLINIVEAAAKLDPRQILRDIHDKRRWSNRELQRKMTEAAMIERKRCAGILAFAADLPDTTPDQREFLNEIREAILSGERGLRWAVGK